MSSFNRLNACSLTGFSMATTSLSWGYAVHETGKTPALMEHIFQRGRRTSKRCMHRKSLDHVKCYKKIKQVVR